MDVRVEASWTITSAIIIEMTRDSSNVLGTSVDPYCGNERIGILGDFLQ